MPVAPHACPGCGAPASPDATRCAYCTRPLALIACPGCFATTFTASRFCARCGTAVARRTDAAEEIGPCPRCATPLRAVRVGDTALHECADCGGAWLGAGTLERLCTDRERRASLLHRDARPPASHAGRGAERVRYLACPRCRALMNRVNYARASGVIVDACKAHGVWLDAGELSRLVAFVEGGGLDVARARERERLAEERRLLESARDGWPAAPRESWSGAAPSPGDGATTDLLRLLRVLAAGG